MRKYEHGWTSCSICFQKGECRKKVGRHILVKNPGYWGGKSPQVIVLGFSKGSNQIRVASSGLFEQIAFAGLRDRLSEVLAAVGVLRQGELLDPLFSDPNGRIGFASLLRCSLVTKDGKKVAPKEGFESNEAMDYIRTCMQTFLVDMPISVRVVVLLGTTISVVGSIKNVLAQIFVDFRVFSDDSLAFIAGGRTWIFALHPSRETGRHHQPYVDVSRPHLQRDRTAAAVRATLG